MLRYVFFLSFCIQNLFGSDDRERNMQVGKSLFESVQRQLDRYAQEELQVDHDRFQPLSACGCVGANIDEWLGDLEYTRRKTTCCNKPVSLHRCPVWILTPDSTVTRVNNREKSPGQKVEEVNRKALLVRGFKGSAFLYTVNMFRFSQASSPEGFGEGPIKEFLAWLLQLRQNKVAVDSARSYQPKAERKDDGIDRYELEVSDLSLWRLYIPQEHMGVAPAGGLLSSGWEDVTIE